MKWFFFVGWLSKIKMFFNTPGEIVLLDKLILLSFFSFYQQNLDVMVEMIKKFIYFLLDILVITYNMGTFLSYYQLRIKQ